MSKFYDTLYNNLRDLSNGDKSEACKSYNNSGIKNIVENKFNNDECNYNICKPTPHGFVMPEKVPGLSSK